MKEHETNYMAQLRNTIEIKTNLLPPWNKCKINNTEKLALSHTMNNKPDFNNFTIIIVRKVTANPKQHCLLRGKKINLSLFI